MDHTTAGGFMNWFNYSANHPSEIPEHCPYPQYPYSYPHVSPAQQYAQNFFEPSGFNPHCPMPPTSSSEGPQVVADGHGEEEDDDDDEQNNEKEENRSRRLSWTEADDIRLVCVPFLVIVYSYYI